MIQIDFTFSRAKFASLEPTNNGETGGKKQQKENTISPAIVKNRHILNPAKPSRRPDSPEKNLSTN